MPRSKRLRWPSSTALILYALVFGIVAGFLLPPAASARAGMKEVAEVARFLELVTNGEPDLAP